MNSSTQNKAINKNEQDLLNRKKMIERFFEILFLILTVVSILSVILICGFIFFRGVPAIIKIGPFNFLFSKTWKPTNNPPEFGILPMILGSIYVTLGSVIIGVPIGVLTAIFMSYFCPKKLYKPLKTALNLMAGIPSIVFGYFALMVLVPFFRSLNFGNGMNIFTASILLGIMILPTIINLSESAITAVPKSFYRGALALGVSHEKAVFEVVVPAAKSGIFSSIILGIGRSIGETMAVIMVAGNQPRIPKGIFDGVRTMTMNVVTEMNYAAGLHLEALIATGAVLFVFILIINLCFNLVNKGERY